MVLAIVFFYFRDIQKIEEQAEQMKLEIFTADTSTELPLPFADQGIKAGFPSPAQDFMDSPLDFNRDMIKHPEATFYARVIGDSMKDEGITEGDILVIDRALESRHGSLAVCAVDGEFTLKRIKIDGERLFLMPANERYSPIEVTEANEFMVWGVVDYIIKKV